MPGDFGLYVHVPFCARRCPYCSFDVVVGRQALHASYGAALIRELRRARPEFAAPAASVFVGGGTPSLFPLEHLAALTEEIRRWAAPAADAEWSIEANPESALPAWLDGARRLGFARLSLGVQSFSAPLLAALGRQHDAAAARRAVAAARRAGFDNLNLDLMYGCPGQTPRAWREDLEAALALEPEHLSLYALSLEERSRLANQAGRGKVVVPGDDAVADMYEHACERLRAAGWEHYEISNWARAGRRCRHNLLYWRRGEYVGIGLGAHSHVGGARFASPRRLRRYLEVYATDQGPRAREELEQLSASQRLGEELFLGLRLAEGIDAAALRARYGSATTPALQLLAQLVEHGLAVRNGDRYALTDRGRLVSDDIFRRFV